MLTLKQSFKLNLKSNRTRSHHILYFKFCQFYSVVVSNIFDVLCIMFCGLLTICFTFCSCNYHLSCFENECSCTWRLLFSHYYCCKTFWIVFRIFTLDCNLIQIELTIQIGCGYQVLQLWLHIFWFLICFFYCQRLLCFTRSYYLSRNNRSLFLNGHFLIWSMNWPRMMWHWALNWWHHAWILLHLVILR